jgi:hypothetical protein
MNDTERVGEKDLAKLIELVEQFEPIAGLLALRAATHGFAPLSAGIDEAALLLRAGSYAADIGSLLLDDQYDQVGDELSAAGKMVPGRMRSLRMRDETT